MTVSFRIMEAMWGVGEELLTHLGVEAWCGSRKGPGTGAGQGCLQNRWDPWKKPILRRGAQTSLLGEFFQQGARRQHQTSEGLVICTLVQPVDISRNPRETSLEPKQKGRSSPLASQA